MAAMHSIITHLQEDAERHNHRRLLVVSGSFDWCEAQVNALKSLSGAVWVGTHAPEGIQPLPASKTHQLLGRSVSSLVFNAWDGFNPNSFGQVSGALTGGGLLVLLCPDLALWPDYDDPEHENLVAYPYASTDAGRRFISRVTMLLEDDAYTVIYREREVTSGIEIELPNIELPSSQTIEPILPNKTVDQQHAVELILSQFRRGRRPVVLTADRGRGKSVALGIAAAQLSGLDYEQIVVTAPEYAAAEEIFLMAHQLLPDYEYSKGLLCNGDHSIRFVEPEVAIRESGEGQVLLVDEAAAIPVPVLTKLLKRFPRIAFASTIHGYEGTGQGFSVRFKQVLENETPNWKGHHLKQPIRWADSDPLEQLVFNLLMLNADAADGNALISSFDAQSKLDQVPVIEKLNRDQLIENYDSLGQLFGLLVLAHYRTSPGDLRVLLDSPNLHVWLLKIDNQIAGAILVAEEGPLQEELIEAIWSGERRPRGHLLPQTLVAQEGAKAAASLKAGRIMRIAIHPALQRKGLGSLLLKAIMNEAPDMGWDYLGASFAASPDLLDFWQHNGFETVRLGSTRDSVSGSHAAVVMAAQTPISKQLQQPLRQRFVEQLNYRLSDDLTDLEASIVCGLLQHAGYVPELTEHDHSDLVAFCQHNRSYESCAYAIHKLLLAFLDKLDDKKLNQLLENNDFVLLVERNLQQKSWSVLEQQGQGRKQLMRQLREVVRALIGLISDSV
ncbi:MULTISPECIES: GNAT family N-acetyltransferase [unclassified Neptuniibacter]|uniref:tRNA(Met) cytidine acetyltransferase TmcA n=1 Tax=unclassified Neptuniibacter TaxID=2630693 RepID=UPI0025E3ADF2|nr:MULTISPECIES: GNAT family N-acetyltransferase [unclassified Neptuniibacter]|tara:strand:- start:657 stop:2837 length:2181 start_codon:yes stop_codon:yes gene_type:complete